MCLDECNLFCEDEIDGAFTTPPFFSSVLSLLTLVSVSLFHIQPINGGPDGCLMRSQRALLHAHVSAVEWVTWTDSRWCSLGMRGLIRQLSSIPMQSIIIPFSVFSPKTTEKTLDHHPLCHHLPLSRGMSVCSALGFSSRELAAASRRTV